MCGVPRIAIFYSEAIECFPGMASRFFFKTFVTILVAQVTTGVIIHFVFQIHCISILSLFIITIIIIIIIIIII
jgi:hypothetical protein